MIYDLELALSALADDVRYPQTPAMTESVMARIRSAPARPLVPSRWRLGFAVAAAAVIAVALIAAVGLSPSARRAVAGWLGVDGIKITFDDSARRSPRPSDPHLGELVSASRAEAAVAFDILVPAELGEPDAYYLRHHVDGDEISLVWEPSQGLPESKQTGLGAVLSVFVGDAGPEFIKKTAASGTSVIFVSVSGREGYFIGGAPHLLIRTSDGGERIVEPRLAGNTLIWDRGDVTYRLEAAVGQDRAVEIAESLEPVKD